MRGHHHKIQKHSLKAKIAGADTRSQGRRRQSQALKKMNYPNHGYSKRHIPLHLVSATSNSKKKSRMPNNVKTYDGSDDLEDHLQIFQAAAKVEHWAMPTWCHMFNSTLTGSARVWFDDLPPESIDNYHNLKKAFLANYLQQKKCIKDPGALECMRISGFMHGITNPELIKRLHDNIPKSVDEMMWVTTAFLRGEVAASNQARKKILPAWKQQEVGRKQNFDRRGDFRNQ
ncbi:reverse transcriptase domain-containing protein [Tanacetum coccineum]|uniref:Reverse transcriptase domain-containing protein n=1 Tax=Tanacetum coccineum TaxID=301880 RepID=A0ABQ5CE71_9ASTR